MTVTLNELLDQTTTLHSHLCPRQVLGVRMGMLAAELLDLDLPQRDKRLHTFVETDGCFADGIAVATGCWLGHRTMRLMDFGKVAATFFDSTTERALRIWAHPDSRQNALDAEPLASSHWHAQLAAYQTLPADQLLRWQDVELSVDMQALISRPGVRVICAHCGEEILNERERYVDGEPCCRACCDEAYYCTE